jgi:hypothetical protein
MKLHALTGREPREECFIRHGNRSTYVTEIDRPAARRKPRQLSGVKRTSQLNRAAAAYDPKRTLDASFGFRRHSTDLRIAGAIHTSHELMVKASNQEDNHRCMSVQDTAASGGISGR